MARKAATMASAAVRVTDVAADEADEQGKGQGARARRGGRRVRLEAREDERDIADLLGSYRLALRADNKAPSTVRNYCDVVRQLADFLSREGLPTAVGAVERRHLQLWQVWQLEHFTRATASDRHGWLRQFWKWCVADGVIERSPMEGMRQPKAESTPRPVFTDEQISRLLRVCERGRDFLGLRDAALIRVLLDTGARRQGLADLTWRDVEWETGVVRIRAKRGSGVFDEYYGRLGHKAQRALDRYKRVAEVHPRYPGPAGRIWIGHSGPISGPAILVMMKRRAVEAGLDPDGIFVHLGRHSFAHHWLAAGGSERDLRKLGNWRSDVALKYGAVLDMERALESKKTRSLSDLF